MLREALRSVGALTSAGQRNTDFGPAEVAQLVEGGFEDAFAPPVRRDEPVARTAAAYVALLSTALNVKETAKMLRVVPSRIRQQLAQRTLYGIKARGGEWRLPRFQFDPPGRVPGIEAVLRALPADLHPIEVSTWFTTPDEDLVLGAGAVSPRDWLLSGGDSDRVAAIARDL